MLNIYQNIKYNIFNNMISKIIIFSFIFSFIVFANDILKYLQKKVYIWHWILEERISEFFF